MWLNQKECGFRLSVQEIAEETAEIVETAEFSEIAEQLDSEQLEAPELNA